MTITDIASKCLDVTCNTLYIIHDGNKHYKAVYTELPENYYNREIYTFSFENDEIYIYYK